MDVFITFELVVSVCEEKVRERNCSYSGTSVVNEKGHRFRFQLTWPSSLHSLWLCDRRVPQSLLTSGCDLSIEGVKLMC